MTAVQSIRGGSKAGESKWAGCACRHRVLLYMPAAQLAQQLYDRETAKINWGRLQGEQPPPGCRAPHRAAAGSPKRRVGWRAAPGWLRGGGAACCLGGVGLQGLVVALLLLSAAVEKGAAGGRRQRQDTGLHSGTCRRCAILVHGGDTPAVHARWGTGAWQLAAGSGRRSAQPCTVEGPPGGRLLLGLLESFLHLRRAGKERVRTWLEKWPLAAARRSGREVGAVCTGWARDETGLEWAGWAWAGWVQQVQQQVQQRQI